MIAIYTLDAWFQLLSFRISYFIIFSAVALLEISKCSLDRCFKCRISLKAGWECVKVISQPFLLAFWLCLCVIVYPKSVWPPLFIAWGTVIVFFCFPSVDSLSSVLQQQPEWCFKIFKNNYRFKRSCKDSAERCLVPFCQPPLQLCLL